MEKVSGIDLDKFFDQWLYKGGIIKLDVEWDYDEKSKNIEFNITQVQNDGYLFEMPLDIEILGDNNSNTSTIRLDKKSGKYLVYSENKPKEIKLDPYTKLLATWSIN